jgi:hypothetical protein
MDNIVNENKFQCWRCLRILPFTRRDVDGVSQTIGVVTSERGTHCYDCQARFVTEAMSRDRKVVLYITGREELLNRWAVNFTHNLRFKIHLSNTTVKDKYTRIDVWFWGPDDHLWHGINFNKNTMLRCYRLHEKSKTPINENSYFHKYPY